MAVSSQIANARKRGANVPDVGQLKMTDRLFPSLPTFAGSVFSKPDDHSQSVPASCVVDCDLFDFSNGMDPKVDTFMTDRSEAIGFVNHAFSKVFENPDFGPEFCKKYNLDPDAQVNMMVDQFRRKAVETYAMIDICTHTSKYPRTSFSKKHLKSGSERKLFDGKKVPTRPVLLKAMSSMKDSLLKQGQVIF